ncbi:MAG TPA: CopD family protein [Steroidobacteraceae bacterium]|nr:CopD family protein [Steroidobacteraceae bacterium]
MLEALAALTKALLYGALLTASGAPLAAASLRLSDPPRDYLLRIMRTAAIAAIALNLLVTALLFIRLGGSFDEPTFNAMFSSGPGAALLLQLTGAALLLTPADNDSSGHAWRITAAIAMTASAAFSGHAAAVSLPAGLLGMAHVTGAAWWVASLWLLRRACISAEGDELVQLVARFSWLAIRIVAGLIALGVALIVVLVNFDESPWRTDYVQTLALKLVFVALVLGFAIHNKLQLTPRLPREAAALRRSIDFELAAIASVLLITAVLTTYFAPEQ